MRILSVVHTAHAATTEIFRPAGHEGREWAFADGGTPPDDYDAYMVFGGAMHADQDHLHPRLRHEGAWLQGLLERGRPPLRVCPRPQPPARAPRGRGGGTGSG